MTPEDAIAAGRPLLATVLDKQGRPIHQMGIIGVVRLEQFDVLFEPGWYMPAHAGHPIHAAPGHFEQLNNGNPGLTWVSGRYWIDEVSPGEEGYSELLAQRADAEKAGAVARMESVARESYAID